MKMQEHNAGVTVDLELKWINPKFSGGLACQRGTEDSRLVIIVCAHVD